MRRVIGAQEAERLRVAQELHDEVGQNLTAALLQLARVRKQAGPELEAAVGAATETVRANLDDLRRIAQRLRPQALDELGLTSALSQFSARLSVQAGLEIDARLDSQLPPLTPRGGARDLPRRAGGADERRPPRRRRPQRARPRARARPPDAARLRRRARARRRGASPAAASAACTSAPR